MYDPLIMIAKKNFGFHLILKIMVWGVVRYCRLVEVYGDHSCVAQGRPRFDSLSGTENGEILVTTEQ